MISPICIPSATIHSDNLDDLQIAIHASHETWSSPPPSQLMTGGSQIELTIAHIIGKLRQ